ncbi:hypothetical protein FHR36_006485 [Kitasatospora paracochleata]|uniref:Uncharacterized protein n=1 Tax=Kitasatospora paracochleata TaxID=58354 RepID=A0ABT1J835_9ACTN|nr:hypothetical protein [Kitasatospora paracochleata]
MDSAPSLRPGGTPTSAPPSHAPSLPAIGQEGPINDAR